jgi:hypothetical protein
MEVALKIPVEVVERLTHHVCRRFCLKELKCYFGSTYSLGNKVLSPISSLYNQLKDFFRGRYEVPVDK